MPNLDTLKEVKLGDLLVGTKFWDTFGVSEYGLGWELTKIEPVEKHGMLCEAAFGSMKLTFSADDTVLVKKDDK